MKKSILLSRYTALLLIVCILASCFAGCGNRPVDPTEGTSGQISTSPTGSTVDSDSKPQRVIKNVIFMVADGGGYDNYTLADKVKQTMVSQNISSLAGAKTEVTTNLLSPLGKEATNGLYLDEFLVGSANTLLLTPNGEADQQSSYITDSAAAGTALSSGYKTTYNYAGIDSDKNPRASLTELARLNGMSTGLVTTKSYVDATPVTFFTSHAIHRHEYQDNSLQALLSGIDVMIGEGTEYGDMVETETSHPDISPTRMGYTVARSKTALLEKAFNTATKKLWAPILGVYNSSKELKEEETDKATDHLSYDVEADQSTEQPSLLDMTKAALQVLGSNINDPDGFFLMIEGGALDNAAEPCHLRAAVGEYLAFDEAFGYCVNWAAQRNDTIVIAVPDHDSGGFAGIESCEELIIDSIISGSIGDTEFTSLLTYADIKKALSKLGGDSSNMSFVYGHSEMAVPICLYAPDSVKTTLLENMGLPTAAGDIRLGDSEYYVPNQGDSFTWYTSSALNNDYTIENSSIAPAIAKTAGMGSLDDATAILFNKVAHLDEDENTTGEYGGELAYSDDYHDATYSLYCSCTYTNQDVGLTMGKNATAYTLNGVQKSCGTIGNQPLKSLYVLDERLTPEYGTYYVPYTVLVESKLAWSVTITNNSWGFDKILTAKPGTAIVLPQIDGAQATFTDGANTYHSGDSIAHSGSNIVLSIVKN